MGFVIGSFTLFRICLYDPGISITCGTCIGPYDYNNIREAGPSGCEAANTSMNHTNHPTFSL